MKLINKKIIAAALAFATLTGCDSLNNNEKDKVETETDQVETAETNEAADTADKDADTDADGADSDADADSKDADTDTDGEDADADSEDIDGGQNVTTGPDADDPTKDASPEEESEAITDPGTTDKEKLEDAIFNNRIQARAAEILLEQSPETIASIRPELEELVERSHKLIDEAQQVLDTL